MKKLYTIKIESEIAVLASDPNAAVWEAMHCIGADSGTVQVDDLMPMDMERPPRGWDKNSVPFGGDGEKTIAELVEMGCAPRWRG